MWVVFFIIGTLPFCFVIHKVPIRVVWVSPSDGVLNFDVDGIARGKLVPAGVGGPLCNDAGVVLLMLSKHIGCIESIEVGWWLF